MIDDATLKLLVAGVLRNADRYDWTVQGLGMMRTYLSKEVRLHVWHSALRTPGVSTMHTHPWHFDSVVVAGEVRNRRWTPHPRGMAFNAQKLACGIGGGLVDAPTIETLVAHAAEIYVEGDGYHQQADEIHESEPEDGTVTIITREFQTDELHARVFWPIGEPWKTAEPSRPAGNQVQRIAQFALTKWFGEAGHG